MQQSESGSGEEIEVQNGVMLMRWHGIRSAFRKMRCACEFMHGHVFTCVLDVSSGIEIDHWPWELLVNHTTMPAALVLSESQVKNAREIAARLALTGGVLGVFTTVESAAIWARRQSIVFAGGVGLRSQVFECTSRKPSPLRLGQRFDLGSRPARDPAR